MILRCTCLPWFYIEVLGQQACRNVSWNVVWCWCVPSAPWYQCPGLSSLVMCCSLSPKCKSHRCIFHIWEWGTLKYSPFDNNTNTHTHWPRVKSCLCKVNSWLESHASLQDRNAQPPPRQVHQCETCLSRPSSWVLVSRFNVHLISPQWSFFKEKKNLMEDTVQPTGNDNNMRNVSKENYQSAHWE